MTLRETLPSREEINELSAEALEEIKDEIDLRRDESTRERMFINASREVCDRDTYLAIWAAVDAALDRVAQAA